jgi:hypothetical protein
MKRKAKEPRPLIDREVMAQDLLIAQHVSYESTLESKLRAKRGREADERLARMRRRRKAARERQQRQEAGRAARKGSFKVPPATLQANLTGIMARNPDLSLTSARNRVARKHGLTIKTTTRHTRRPTLQELEQARQRPRTRNG